MTEEHRTLEAAEALLDVARARLIAYRQYDNLNAASNMRGINHRRCECGICIAVDKWMAEHNAYLARPAAPAAAASAEEEGALAREANLHAHYAGEAECLDADFRCWGCSLRDAEAALNARPAPAQAGLREALQSAHDRMDNVNASTTRAECVWCRAEGYDGDGLKHTEDCIIVVCRAALDAQKGEDL